MKNELKMIKKLYGEQMAHYCRDNFATILEEDGVLLHILTSNFNPSHNIYNDLYLSRSLDEFKNFIFNKFESRDKKFPDAICKSTAHHQDTRPGTPRWPGRNCRPPQNQKRSGRAAPLSDFY